MSRKCPNLGGINDVLKNKFKDDYVHFYSQLSWLVLDSVGLVCPFFTLLEVFSIQLRLENGIVLDNL